MDLRIVKTKKAIRESFFALRENTPLNKVKVVDLCSDAVINKTTFYKYYADVSRLSSDLEDEMFQNFWDDFAAKDCLFSDPERFIRELPPALDRQARYLVPLFHDRTDVFFNRLERELLMHYIVWDGPRHETMRSTFFLCGVVRMLREMKEHGKFTLDELAEDVAAIIRRS